MRFGICGLGRMGESLAVQALEKGHDVIGYDPGGSEAVESGGGHVVSSVEELSTALNPPRVALVYVPQGAPTDDVVGRLAGGFEAGDVIVDGGNSHWEESRRRHEELEGYGIHFVDAGTSGGVTGARHGACFMVND